MMLHCHVKSNFGFGAFELRERERERVREGAVRRDARVERKLMIQ